MRLTNVGLILASTAILFGCGRSKPPELYVLSPIPCHKMQISEKYAHLRIGINPVKIPEYIQKPEITLHCSKHQVKLAENHHWAESLKDNITRILQTNLTTLLPGAVVQKSPWYSQFFPTYTLDVMISQFETDIYGNHIFRAEYLIYHDNRVVKNGQICYKKKLPVVTPLTVVNSMNDNINQLSKEIMLTFKSM
ncbi:PqiC family protein [Legionella impletisoli]|uniref:ABC-type transport auxiliary lipoprotein component domain-containing protein n=1 Tax=Legionella impletisoli TaxID=343510 RepID=A0A917JQL1_9GAMM|nr:PqiC family protein [Legionella impletisoli]GGI80445.1 hypothetical protein GCM10007966_06200 [Legionella impletisoli]